MEWNNDVLRFNDDIPRSSLLKRVIVKDIRAIQKGLKLLLHKISTSDSLNQLQEST